MIVKISLLSKNILNLHNIYIARNAKGRITQTLQFIVNKMSLE